MIPQARASRTVRVSLAAWNQAIDDLIQSREAIEAIARLRIVLRNLPRHLPSYFRLLQAIWILRRWGEGEDWALRLLRADPCNELAWAVLANSAEQRGNLADARRLWSRALDFAPYSPHIRAGVIRTSPGREDPLRLSPVALATLCRMDGRWERAAALFAQLQQENPRQVDLQCAWLESLWRAGRQEEALRLASHLVRREPNLLIGWLVSAHIGDETDQALAHAPLGALDPDGEYMLDRFGVSIPPSRPATIALSGEEAAHFAE